MVIYTISLPTFFIHCTSEYCDPSGPKTLPLGHEFQLMVKRFTDPEADYQNKYRRTEKLIQQLQ